MILSIEFGSNIKIVERYKRKGLPVITKAVRLDVSTDIYDGKIINGDLSQIIGDALVENNIKAKKAIFVINSDDIIIRKINLPFLKKESERLSMILLELGQIISADLNQYKVIYKIADTYEENGIVNAAYVTYCLPNYIYKQLLQLAESLNLQLLAIDSSANCLNHISEQSIKLNNENLNNEDVYAFINIGLTSLSFYTLNKGVNDFCKVFSSINKIELAAESQSHYIVDDVSDGMMFVWLEEINKCIRHYHYVDKRRINKIYIYGYYSNVWNLERLLSLNLNIDVEVIRSIFNINFEENILVNEYLIPVLALTDIKALNFLSKGTNYNLAILRGITITVVFFSLLFIIFGNSLSFKGNGQRLSPFANDEENMEDNPRLQKLKEETKILESRINYIERAISTINRESICSEILREIYDSIPENTKIVSFDANRNDVNVQYVSKSIMEVISLLDNLQSIDFIEEIHIPSVQARTREDYSYSVICKLKDADVIEFHKNNYQLIFDKAEGENHFERKKREYLIQLNELNFNTDLSQEKIIRVLNDCTVKNQIQISNIKFPEHNLYDESGIEILESDDQVIEKFYFTYASVEFKLKFDQLLDFIDDIKSYDSNICLTNVRIITWDEDVVYGLVDLKFYAEIMG